LAAAVFGDVSPLRKTILFSGAEVELPAEYPEKAAFGG